MATSFVNTNPQFTINTGGNFAPNAGGEVEFFAVGTTGPSNRKDTYNTPTPDATPTTAQINPNPVPLDSYGRFSVDVYLDGSYNTVIRDKDGNQIDTKDNVSGFGAGGVSSLVVLNVAALRAVDTSLYTYATIEGTTTIDDGGQANFYYDSGSSAADNGTTIIEPTDGGGRWLVLNVETLAIGDNAVTTTKIANSSVSKAKRDWLPFATIEGLKSSNGTDADHDIDIATGNIMDTTDAYLMRLGSAFTKRIDATFAVGTTNGGLSDDDTLGNNTWYGVFLLSKAADPTDCDVIFATTKARSLSDAVATAAGFDISRLIDYVLTDGSANIIRFVDGGNSLRLWDVQAIEASVSGTSRNTIEVQCPPFQIANLSCSLEITSLGGAATVNGLLTSLDQTDTTPSNSLYTMNVATDGTFNNNDSVVIDIKTNSSSQVGARIDNGTNSDLNIFSRGYKIDYTITDLV